MDTYSSTAEKAYTLGMIWGDGWLLERKNKTKSSSYTVFLSLLKVDYDDIRITLNKLGNWKEQLRLRKNRTKEVIQSYINDSTLGKILFDLNYKSKSGASLSPILSIIPKELHSYFWLGLFDADGNFYRKNNTTQICISGAKDANWNELFILLNSLKIKYKYFIREYKTGSHSLVRITNKPGIKNLISYLYEGKLQIGLKRKKDVFAYMLDKV